MAERIVYQAKHTRLIKVNPEAGVQTGLNALARTSKFQQILSRVVGDRGLVYEDVRDRAKRLYDEVSKHAHGNDQQIIVRAKDFTPNECGALITYLLLQSDWPSPLDWRVVERQKAPV